MSKFDGANAQGASFKDARFVDANLTGLRSAGGMPTLKVRAHPRARYSPAGLTCRIANKSTGFDCRNAPGIMTSGAFLIFQDFT
jgi:uncharacterized protein YjbI with pentapeptide repeats